MFRVTVAEPANHPPELTSAESPLWVDRHGNLYRVASGLQADVPPGAWLASEQDPTAPPPPANPTFTTVLAGPCGLSALAALGLEPAVLHDTDP
ncbi:hypothetical protein [Roseinatronobacter sp. NSM]|uniref:hypothetical protein n=1 Tax=Roseinatronobacter sp. NSM TaxID=3457785 RepID=UPI0040372127